MFSAEQNEGKELSKEEKQRLRKEKKQQKKSKEKKDEKEKEKEKKSGGSTATAPQAQPSTQKGTHCLGNIQCLCSTTYYALIYNSIKKKFLLRDPLQ